MVGSRERFLVKRIEVVPRRPPSSGRCGCFVLTQGEKMDFRQAIRSQYLSALEMLKQAVECCPEAMWAGGETQDHLWRIAYHALFYTHLYLQKTVADFKAWPKHLEGAERQDTPLEKIG